MRAPSRAPSGARARRRLAALCAPMLCEQHRRCAPAAHLRRHAAPRHGREPAAAPHLLLLRPARLLPA
eukprot:1574120-Prymnesium_polylepis.1